MVRNAIEHNILWTTFPETATTGKTVDTTESHEVHQKGNAKQRGSGVGLVVGLFVSRS